MQVAAELARRVLLPLGDGHIFDCDFQILVVVDGDRVSVVVDEADRDVGRLFTFVDLQFPGRRSDL